MSNSNSNETLTRRLWHRISSPSQAALGTLLVVGLAAGVIIWGSFNWIVELSNTETFCISCHEMEDNAYAEFRDSIHYSNRSGVRATCPDCHVPKTWAYKMMRKVAATNELWHKAMGSIDTPEKFENKRFELAMMEWIRMKKTDSRECRNCHNFDYMDFSEQGRRSSRIHEEGAAVGKTCIDCHKGIAHDLPLMDMDKVNAELAKYGD
jgi:cytochrome c-type protein NapC